MYITVLILFELPLSQILIAVIEIGTYNDLFILRETSVGIYLGDENGEDVLLPNKYCPEPGTYDIGDELRVFVYLDYAERKVATNIEPKILLNEFALLEVAAVEDAGAFMDWGLEKQLLVPYREQRQDMELGRWYIVYMDIDIKTQRLYGTNKFTDILQNDILTVNQGEEVDALVYKVTDLGYNCIINNEHRGLIYEDESERELRVGQRMTAYIKSIRPDNKIDLSLKPLGYENTNSEHEQTIMEALEFANGSLPYHDKSDPEAIKTQFLMSKKSFKKAIGGLYRKKLINISKTGIELL